MITFQLPQGLNSHSYLIYLFVNIIDDTGGTTVYFLSKPVTVKPNDQLVESLIDSILHNETGTGLLLELNSGNLNLISKNAIALATVFNIQSIESTHSTSNSSTIDQMNNQMAWLREFLVRKVFDLSLSNITSIKIVSSVLSVATQTFEQVSSTIAVIKF